MLGLRAPLCWVVTAAAPFLCAMSGLMFGLTAGQGWGRGRAGGGA